MQSQSNNSSPGILERRFHLQENGTTVKREVVGGITGFVAVAYILAVNPAILSATGMNPTAVLLATALASAIATILMGFMANYPFILSSGMGLNAYMAFTVVLMGGYSWQMALFCVFCEGVIFVILSVTKVREMIFDAIPQSLKYGISAGIGAFIFFIAAQNAGIVQGNSSTLVTIVNFKENFSTTGICALLALIGFLITAFVHYKDVPGAILVGIFITWIMGMLCQLLGIYQPDAEAGYYSVYPTFQMTDFSALKLTFGQCFEIDFSTTKLLDFVVVTLTFLYSDMFDTIGTLIGGATKGGLLKDGKLPNIRGALLADSLGTVLGAIFGTSTITTFVESSAGIAAGARTGLSAIVAGLLFLVATFAASIFTSIPSFATAPALMLVGFLMFAVCGKISFQNEDKLLSKISAFLCIISMILFYSIAEGIAVGVISYTILNGLAALLDKIDERFRGKQITEPHKVRPLMYILTVILLLKYVLL